MWLRYFPLYLTVPQGICALRGVPPGRTLWAAPADHRQLEGAKPWNLYGATRTDLVSALGDGLQDCATWQKYGAYVQLTTPFAGS